MHVQLDLVSAFPMDGFEAQQRALTIRIASTGAIALVVATLIGLALSRQLASPIADLVDATRKIRQGDYDLELPPSSTREMDTLATSFNEMAAGLKLLSSTFSLAWGPRVPGTPTRPPPRAPSAAR
jgi:nitrogen fixation/metabolism regulation signal transduction histidine kinase